MFFRRHLVKSSPGSCDSPPGSVVRLCSRVSTCTDRENSSGQTVPLDAAEDHRFPLGPWREPSRCQISEYTNRGEGLAGPHWTFHGTNIFCFYCTSWFPFQFLNNILGHTCLRMFCSLISFCLSRLALVMATSRTDWPLLIASATKKTRSSSSLMANLSNKIDTEHKLFLNTCVPVSVHSEIYLLRQQFELQTLSFSWQIHYSTILQ